MPTTKSKSTILNYVHNLPSALILPSISIINLSTFKVHLPMNLASFNSLDYEEVALLVLSIIYFITLLVLFMAFSFGFIVKVTVG